MEVNLGSPARPLTREFAQATPPGTPCTCVAYISMVHPHDVGKQGRKRYICANCGDVSFWHFHGRGSGRKSRPEWGMTPCGRGWLHGSGQR